MTHAMEISVMSCSALDCEVTLDSCHREEARLGTEKETIVQQCGKDSFPCLGVETEQAPGLRRRELETWHFEVFRADSAHQSCS
jgi:hypothetical protein